MRSILLPKEPRRTVTRRTVLDLTSPVLGVATTDTQGVEVLVILSEQFPSLNPKLRPPRGATKAPRG